MSSAADDGQDGPDTPAKRVRVLVYILEATDSVFDATLLGRSNLEIIHAANLSELAVSAVKLLPELIILDLERYGDVAARQLLGNPATAEIPLAMIARHEDAPRVPGGIFHLPRCEFYQWDRQLGDILALPYRAAPRVAVNLSGAIRAETATESHAVKVLDLSVTGAQIETAAVLPFAVRLVLQLDLPDECGQITCLTAVQQYHQAADCYRYGLRFTTVDNSSAILLAGFLRSQLASQADSPLAHP